MNFVRDLQQQQQSSSSNPDREPEDAILLNLEYAFNISIDIFRSVDFPYAEACLLEKRMMQCTMNSTENRDRLVYFIMDPTIVKILPSQEDFVLGYEFMDYQLFDRFISSIFYVGQGKEQRPSLHLTFDYQEFKNRTKLDVEPKTRRIWSLWRRRLQPILFNVYEDLTKEEAKMREALIVETIGVSNLTNPLSDNLSRQLTMNLQEKKILGTYLMCKFFLKYSFERGELIEESQSDSD